MTVHPQGKPCPACGEPMSEFSSQMSLRCTNGKCGITWLRMVKTNVIPMRRALKHKGQ